MTVGEADRRVASARSKTTAAVAATRAAPTAIKVICQPAMPPANTGTVAGGTSGPPGGMGMLAEAAGTMAAEASRAQVRAARGRGGPAQVRGGLPGCGARMRSPEGAMCGHDHLLMLGTGRLSRPLPGMLARPGHSGAGAGLPLFAPPRRPG